MVGHFYSNFSNLVWQVDNVDYKYGATVVSGNNWGSGDGVTLGSFILGDEDLVADPNNSLFQHEYGHYLQSQAMGPAYFQRVGFPSMFSKGDHDFHPVEQDANRRAFMYFNKEVGGFYQTADQFRFNIENRVRRGWDFNENPLNVDGSNREGIYLDYKDFDQFRSLSRLTIRAYWYDYLDTFIPAGINTSFYNRGR
ncbi:hypothetical protein H1R17_11245 [Flavobacterium sp. xlx-214]|uniref:hypothetical protein n=1 Tax=unclassified Flavobacterium TaxID=196869 RepID=UPI0013D13EC6|nr:MULTISPECIES: hypothetical protein [unclassified Flavobacterium]MBA5791790.1 hypothetical protein [Flavobacterium sp. xlx-221]QMI83029.1 hypothetical protein H1R17_11245 [Flavobacterium sp. xlx-214]